MFFSYQCSVSAESGISYTYGLLSVLAGDFYGIIHSRGGVLLVPMTGKRAITHNCRMWIIWGLISS